MKNLVIVCVRVQASEWKASLQMMMGQKAWRLSANGGGNVAAKTESQTWAGGGGGTNATREG